MEHVAKKHDVYEQTGFETKVVRASWLGRHKEMEIRITSTYCTKRQSNQTLWFHASISTMKTEL